MGDAGAVVAEAGISSEALARVHVAPTKEGIKRPLEALASRRLVALSMVPHAFGRIVLGKVAHGAHEDGIIPAALPLHQGEPIPVHDVGGVGKPAGAAGALLVVALKVVRWGMVGAWLWESTSRGPTGGTGASFLPSTIRRLPRIPQPLAHASPAQP